MSGGIVTKDLGDGYLLHSYNIQTYQLVETLISPIAIPEIQTENSPPITSAKNLGSYQPYRLSQFVNSKDAIVGKGELVQLARVQNGQLVINPHAITIFERYPENDLSFVGNYGRSKSGKSFWYDKILNLSSFDGNNYCSNQGKQGIYFWSIPFTKGNLKFFLLDYVGFDGKDTLTKQDERLLDLQLLLAQKFVIVPQPEDDKLTVLQPAYNHLLKSQQRFSDRGIAANKFSAYWPNEIYTLYRSARPVRKEIDNIGTLFEVYNFSILHDAMQTSATGSKADLLKSTLRSQNSAAPLNERYVRMTNVVFQDIYEKMKGKVYGGGVACTGSNINRVLQQATININKGRGVQVDQIYNGVKKNVSGDTLTRSKILFMKQLQFYRRSGQPQPLDDLIAGFQRGNAAAYAQLDRMQLPKAQKQQNQYKLRQELDQLQKDILQENRSKTLQHYFQVLPNSSTDTQQAYVSKLKQSFISDKSIFHLDQSDSVPVAERLKTNVKTFTGSLAGSTSGNLAGNTSGSLAGNTSGSLAGNTSGDTAIIINTKQKSQSQNLKLKIATKKKQLFDLQHQQSLKSKKNPQITQIDQKQKVITTKIYHLKKNLQIQKSNLKGTSSTNHEQQLAQLRQIHAKNEQQKTTIINDNTPRQQEIKILKDLIRRAAAKNKPYEEGLATIDKSFSNRSGKSVIRDIQSENIKKVTIK